MAGPLEVGLAALGALLVLVWLAGHRFRDRPSTEDVDGEGLD